MIDLIRIFIDEKETRVEEGDIAHFDGGTNYLSVERAGRKLRFQNGALSPKGSLHTGTSSIPNAKLICEILARESQLGIQTISDKWPIYSCRFTRNGKK